MKTSGIYHLIVRLAKEHSAFFYFTLEANEGLGFYSTLPHTEGDLHRDIDIKGPLDFLAEVERIITVLNEKFPVTVLERNILN